MEEPRERAVELYDCGYRTPRTVLIMGAGQLSELVTNQAVNICWGKYKDLECLQCWFREFISQRDPNTNASTNVLPLTLDGWWAVMTKEAFTNYTAYVC